MNNKFTKTIFTGAICMSGMALGQVQVDWGQTSFGANITNMSPGDLNDDPSVLFELGVFDVGFDPNMQSPDTWASAWNVLSSPDQSSIGATGGSVGGSFTFGPASGAGEGDIQSNASPFAPGTQLYIWGVVGGAANQTIPAGGSQDWVLFTANDSTNTTTIEDNNWIIPDTQADNFGTSHGDGLRTLASATALESVVGSVDNATGNINFETVVPEPSSMMLLSLSGLALLRRRR